ncbi:MAG: FAD-dependent oxidoreductase [Spirochaetia bacterium]|nr:FAD-dependent oxidoreductase [Spirochaetia bacterium]
MGKHVTEINESQFETLVTGSDKPVILDFYSTECPPCEALASKFEEYAELFSDYIYFYKVFRQENRSLANQLNVQSSPTLLFFNNGREVAKRLSGGIRKQELKDTIQNMVSPEVFQNVMSRRKKTNRKADVIILGGGPAGLTAAIYSAQAKLNTILIDPALPGGQVATTHMISNYPGTGGPVPGWELSHKMLEQAKESGAEILAAVDITSLKCSKIGETHYIQIDEDLELESPVVILAMGADPRKLGIPGESEYRGKGISYCATCDGKYFDGKEVVVIGGGNSAIEESLFLTRFATKVTIVHQFDELQANKTAQEHAHQNEKIHFILNSEPRSFEAAENNQMSVKIENTKTGEVSELITDGIFIFIGMVPNAVHLPDALDKNHWGYILTDEDMKTNLPGVYAAGDIRSKKIRQAATAVSDGCIAGINAEKYIDNLKIHEKERKLMGLPA